MLVKAFSEKVSILMMLNKQLIKFFVEKVKQDITAAAEAEGKDAFSDDKDDHKANLITLAETISKADTRLCGCWENMAVMLNK